MSIPTCQKQLPKKKKAGDRKGRFPNIATVVCESTLTLNASPGDTEVKLT